MPGKKFCAIRATAPPAQAPMTRLGPIKPPGMPRPQATAEAVHFAATIKIKVIKPICPMSAEFTVS